SSLAGVSCREASAIGSLGSRGAQSVDVVVGAAVILDLSVAAPEAGRPVGIPVVVERTTDTPSARQDDATRSASAGHVDAISRVAEGNALVSAAAAATEHREVRRRTAGGDHGLGVTLCVRDVDLDVVACTRR